MATAGLDTAGVSVNFSAFRCVSMVPISRFSLLFIRLSFCPLNISAGISASRRRRWQYWSPSAHPLQQSAECRCSGWCGGGREISMRIRGTIGPSRLLTVLCMNSRSLLCTCY